MAKIYSKAPDECIERVAHLIKLFHSPLLLADVKIDLLSVANDDDDKPALALHGYPCLAIIRITGVKERTKGAGDAEIIIDESRYLALDDPSRDALLDHEIYHLELRIDKKTDKVKLDCRGRPKLGMRKHDVQIGHFIEIAERHGAASIECKQATNLYLSHQQTLFAFVGENQKQLQ